DVPAGVTAAALRFGELASLVGYELEGGGRRVAEEGLVPGEALTVTLYWRAAAHTPQPNHVSVQLLPPVGAADPRPVAQHDGPPAGGGRPTTGWRPGEVVTDSHRLVVPPDLAPGEYPLAVVVYDPGPGGARLPVNGQPGAAGTLAVLTVVGEG
ncbi:MAG: hypothetical protein ACE5EL_04705, partial [Anaerolineae bacterium]